MTDAYLEGARLLRQATAGLSPEQARARPVPGKWSTLEVACHLADIDALDATRMKKLVAEDRPLLFDADEMLFAAALAYQHRDLDGGVTLVEQTGRRVARILRTLPEGALARAGDYRVGARVEQRTLEQILAKAIRHFAHHLPFILEKRRALGLG